MREAWIYGRNPLGLSVRHIRKTGENGEKKLFSVYKRFCKRAQEQNLKTEWVSEISAIMASIAFSEGVGQLVDTPMRKLRDFCELFGADVEKTEEISKIIGEEI